MQSLKDCMLARYAIVVVQKFMILYPAHLLLPHKAILDHRLHDCNFIYAIQ